MRWVLLMAHLKVRPTKIGSQYQKLGFARTCAGYELDAVAS
jgi:hypothetical protein